MSNVQAATTDGLGTAVWPECEFEASAEYWYVEQRKRKLHQLAARVDALREAEDKMRPELERLEAEMAEMGRELDVAIAAPASGGHDPTLELPDELLIGILLVVPFAALWEGRCAQVCRRWRALVESGPLERRKQTGRWEAYAKEWIKPRTIGSHDAQVISLAVGPDGSLYSGSRDATVRVWGGPDLTHIRTLRGHTEGVCQLAVGPDGTVYSGSLDATICVWSGEDGARIRTLIGHSDFICALAVGPNEKVYSGSDYSSLIRVWSTRHGGHLQSLEGHTDQVASLIVGQDGRVYSASIDSTIHVWSGDDGAHLHTLEGHTDCVNTLVWGPGGLLCSGSSDRTIRMWTGQESTIFTTTRVAVGEAIVWTDSTLFARLGTELIWGWPSTSGPNPPSFVMTPHLNEGCGPLAGGADGKLFAAQGGLICMM